MQTTIKMVEKCMQIEELFEMRSSVAIKLKDCIRDAGHTKISFSQKYGIPICELENLLNGTLEDKDRFILYVAKILSTVKLSAGELLCYERKKNAWDDGLANDILLDIQYDPKQNNYIYSFRMSEQEKQKLERRLQNYGATLEEAIPNYLQTVMEREDRNT